MPIYIVPKGNHISVASSQKRATEKPCARDRFGQQFAPSVSENKQCNPVSQPQAKTKELNSTYVLSACHRLANASPTSTHGGRRTLQRRTGTSKGLPDTTTTCNGESTKTETKLILQRRLRTESNGKDKTKDPDEVRGENAMSLPEKADTTLFASQVNSSQAPLLKSGHQPLRSCREEKPNPEMKNHVQVSQSGSTGAASCTPLKHRLVVADFQSQNKVPRSSLFMTAKMEDRIKRAEECSVSKDNGTERLQGRFMKAGHWERQKTPRRGPAEGVKWTPKRGSVPHGKSPAAPSERNKTPALEPMPQKKASTSNASILCNKNGSVPENATCVTQSFLQEDPLVPNVCTKDDPFKIENSKVTVAVRVRPLSSRDKNEEAFQIISMTGQETVVHHPNTKQVYSFTFDFSFWSFDKSPNFASQETVYRSLAVPLLEGAFEGYNTCLFAYGQTGSGKSYTMMGFDDDEQGIIPRFCEDLFKQIQERETPKSPYHLEMSYFEVYNEKIHDLLVFSRENGQEKQPLHVREHPVFGPYVEDLSVNVVKSYSDIQRWLQLGNKHRATASTGMNDKSSRSHSVFTLVMTQTKTGPAEKEEHQHRIISHVNLVDLAGSERCRTAQTSGERRKEGVSINKSLLTLGKVISALSEQNQTRKKAFVPYRESVLTWLLKESLGGNSKTAMIATISPAASNIEETLSTLRYAKQACFIVNVAKVNEDINAKLIQGKPGRHFKLKLAQKNAQNHDPEKQKHYVQEITSLRMKLYHQEREMAEMQRAWKEKLEQAEKKKFEETMELQKAGITFKVDNSLPNLVNLNEDPQLSEMLLYMIKEGKLQSEGEVQKVKNLSYGASLAEDGPKGFEFAKNELLDAQRAQLESEIEEARLKAKEEMIQGIQIAKEMAQEELNSQQKNYESQIKTLEAQLEEESRRKQLHEMNNQMAANKIQELEKAKQGLELEVHFNKKRLKMQTLAAKEILEDHAIHHARILEALEAEKQKIAQEVQILQQSTENRNKEPNWNSLKLSMMIKEANTISSKLEKHTVFCRHDAIGKEKSAGSSLQVQVRNLRLGTNNTKEADDIFYDPTDEWEPDILNVSVSSISAKRRSRSLRKSKRISECLSEVKMRIHHSYLPGSTSKTSQNSDPLESFLPGICQDLIASALDTLEQTDEEEGSLAQSLLEALFTVHSGVKAMTEAYEQAEESLENVFIADRAAQSSSIRITSAFKQLVLLAKHWLNCFRKNDEFVKIYDELREDVKHLGGHLQLLLQGGGSDLSSVVAEAQKKIMETLKNVVKYIGHLAALTGSDLHFGKENKGQSLNSEMEFVSNICDGMDGGLAHLLDCIQERSRRMQNELLKWYPHNEVQNQIRDKAVSLARLLEIIVSDCKNKEVMNLLRRKESVEQELKKATGKALEFLELHHCLDQVFHLVTSSLEASYRNPSPLRYFVEKICILAGNFNALCNPSTSSIGLAEGSVCKISEPLVNQSELDSVAKSLIITFELEHRENGPNFQDDCTLSTVSEEKQYGRSEATAIWKEKQVTKSKLLSLPEGLRESSPIGIHWV
ncbi:hypothetical protein JRQ81_014587 [Phrynocephalus forsythii]|uniref:Kinesin motor domain-containing protein n=1 Tax=Phrynocephalus forsythii TaxID=171643 RepID=A0A9Q0XXM5_9SAUR|nr:hypothetical protein JRQ81_014587 [Phrynocephalus forsythii]